MAKFLKSIENYYNKSLDKFIELADNDRKNFSENRYPNYTCLIANITSRCNLNCPHCIRSKMDEGKEIKEDLALSTFEMFLKAGQKIGARHVSITGGEPILHKDFEKLLEIVKKYSYTFSIISNGLINEEYLKVIDKHKRNFILMAVSIDGATSEVHDSIRNRKGSFEKAVQSLKYYVENDLETTMAVCLNKKNFHQTDEIMNLCLKIGVQNIKWAGHIPLKENDSYGLNDNQRKEAFKKILEFKKKHRKKCFVECCTSLAPMDRNLINFCSIFNGNELNLNFDGTMNFCCDFFQKTDQGYSLEKDGIEKCLKINMDIINNLKKLRIEKLVRGEDVGNGFCIFCNKYGKNCLEKALRQQEDK
jgi:MoaA/NifB/PqqE/SkfB family radical SAM enzyme